MSGTQLLKKLGLWLFAMVYHQCYSTGLFTIGVVHGVARTASVWTLRGERQVGGAWRRLARGCARLRGDAAERLRHWRGEAAGSGAALREGLRQLRHGRARDALRLVGHGLAGAARVARPILRTLVHYTLPVLAAWVLWQALTQEAQTQYALAVRVDGEELGMIADESVYDEALGEVVQKLSGVEGAEADVSAVQLELRPVEGGAAMLDAYELSNRLIARSGGDIDTAYGLYIDGGLVGAVQEQNELLDLLSGMLDRYLTGAPNETVSFIRDVALREGLYPRSRIVTMEQVRERIDREVRGEFVYEAQPGDSASLIAQKFEVPQSQIIANNPGITESLFVGDEIIISRAEPYLAVKIQRMETYNEMLPFSSETREDSSLLKGETKTVREGVPGIARVRAAVTYINDMESERDVISRETLVEPVSEVVSVGSKLFLQNYGGGRVTANFIVPVPSARYISNYFYGTSGNRYNHGALDYPASYGAPIYASAPGTVIYSSYTASGYGHHVIIDHGGGIQTLYAHMSSRVARVGDVVDQGQVIGYIGSTGWSTGNHCHFEIRVNGTKVDPYGYVYG